MNIIDGAGNFVVKARPINGSCCKRLSKATALTSGNFAIV